MVHLSARLAWHDSGWNGCICRNPKANTHCVGQYSYLRDRIVRDRDLDREIPARGQSMVTLDFVPPCVCSANAFGPEPLEAYEQPPSWFGDTTETRHWQIPPYTVAIWPYEEMYKDEVINPRENQPPKYNPVWRRNAANAFFEAIKPDQSLVFYYANYSNPFSENDRQVYVIVGVGRVREIGSELTWTGQSETTLEKYGPSVWVRNVTSHYPDQGLRIPYERYLDQPEVLERILFVPDNPRNFKYAARHITDDGALGLIERLSEIVGVLQELGDDSEDWARRQLWLSSVMAELWHSRGRYPGLPNVWDVLGFAEAVPYTIREADAGREEAVKDALFAFIDGGAAPPPDLGLSDDRVAKLRKRWCYLEQAQQRLLREVLARFDLKSEQVRRIVENPETRSLRAGPEAIAENPYVLSEQYLSDDPDDQVTFSLIDHGVIPSPDLGLEPLFEPDDWQRLRALCVDQLRRADQHTFLPAELVLSGLNHQLSYLPDWKCVEFRQRHLELEQDALSEALHYRTTGDVLYLYRGEVFEDERTVERVLRQMANLPDIQLTYPVTEGFWRSQLYQADSPLAHTHPDAYEGVLGDQIAVCQQVFLRPISVVCGEAGTGKTTIVEAILRAIEKGHGSGVSVQLLAPTGKAADQLRERTRREAGTLHSFLAQHGWLGENMDFHREGGRREDGFTTYVIDESSMLDLPLLAAFFRSVNWNAVQRLIFVGDPNQLPPIGTGKVFADLIDWFRDERPEHVGELKTNVRQLCNRLSGASSGILDLAQIYLRRPLADQKPAVLDTHEDEVLRRVQEGGDVAHDLRVLYWQSPDELDELLLRTLVSDMEAISGRSLDESRPYELWNAAMTGPDDQIDPEAIQVLSPYRGDLFGIDHLNLVLQTHKNRWWLENKGALGGITIYDKVIQTRNRARSRAMWAYNVQTKRKERADFYNGEIGMTKLHAYDGKKWHWTGFYVQQFQVIFSRKEHYWVEFTSDSQVEDNLELAYAISVHKAQGSEFDHVYFVLPKHRRALLSRELFYTGLTRARNHCTLLIQEDVSPLLSLRRRETSHLAQINSSLFQFRPVPPAFRTMGEWYQEGKIHRTLTEHMVRSKSEVIIANMLCDRDIPFDYEVPLRARDGTFYLPDFTINLRGQTWYWEHLGMLDNQRYRDHWEKKRQWYEKHGFADRLIVTTEEDGFDSTVVLWILRERLGVID